MNASMVALGMAFATMGNVDVRAGGEVLIVQMQLLYVLGFALPMASVWRARANASRVTMGLIVLQDLRVRSVSIIAMGGESANLENAPVTWAMVAGIVASCYPLALPSAPNMAPVLLATASASWVLKE